MGSPRNRAPQAAPRILQDEPLLGALQAARAGRIAEAEVVVREAVARAPQAAAPRHALALVLHLQGSLQEAHDELAQAVEADPTDRAARTLLGRLLYDLERDSEARAVLEPLVEADPSDRVTAWQLLTVLMRIADVDAAGSAPAAEPLDPARPTLHVEAAERPEALDQREGDWHFVDLVWVLLFTLVYLM